MNRCPNCERFVSLENGEAEENIACLQGTHITATVRLVRNCADCNEEIKSVELELEGDIPAEVSEEHDSKDCVFELDGIDYEVDETGGARYKANHIVCTATARVRCACGLYDDTITFEGKVAASDFEDMI